MIKNKSFLFYKILLYFSNALILLSLALFNLNYYFDTFEIISIKTTIIILILSNLLKLIYWQVIKSNNIHKIKNEKNNFLFIVFFILTFVLPTYMVYQKNSLIIDEQISQISLLIILIFAILGMLIEKNIFFNKIKKSENFKYEENKI
tara:strand:+ start:161 stop:604 length:444 start_codon:yes stop_codon:yes gene_type:complete